jgi:hypothetical protein
MKTRANLGGAFTFVGTSLTVNRIGYGAMQLAGQDDDKRVWGPPRDIPGAIAVLREAVRPSHASARSIGAPSNRRTNRRAFAR